MRSTWFKITNLSDDKAEVQLYDDIGMGGVDAGQFVSQLKAIKAKNIDVRINSKGGEVDKGLVIYNAIKAHPSEITTHVDGIAASIASVVALAGDSVCMNRNALMMIHNPKVFGGGDAGDLRKQADNLDRIKDNLAKIYADKTGKPLDTIRKAMDDETWFNASEAKAYGLVDMIEGDDGDGDGDGEEDEAMAPAVRACLAFSSVPQGVRDRAERYVASGKFTKQVKQPSPARRPATQESTMPINVISRDGKSYVSVDGKEVEISLPFARAATPDATAPVSNEAAERAGREKERQYAKDFRTAVAAAGFDAKAEEDFEAKFYGRPIEDVKFLASSAIGTRAKPVGEGSGNTGAGTDAEKAAAAEAAFIASCTKRFTEDANVRGLWGVQFLAQGDPQFAGALNRYIASERRWIADQAKHAK